MLVHDAPEPLNRVQMRAIGRDEMQLDPTIGDSEPLAHKLGVMIAGIVEEDMDARQRRALRLDGVHEGDG